MIARSGQLGLNRAGTNCSSALPASERVPPSTVSAFIDSPCRTHIQPINRQLGANRLLARRPPSQCRNTFRRPRRRSITCTFGPPLPSNTATSGCPFHGAAAENGASAAAVQKPERKETVPIPGPHPLDIPSNLADLSHIAREGMEEAVLYLHNKYGPICRFNNGLTAWTFVCDPIGVEHMCATNVKNYTERFLPPPYVYATHGKGILGSTGEYNRQHRKMCQPPFTRTSQLKIFSESIKAQCEELIQVWTDLSASAPLRGDMCIHMQRLTLDIVGTVAFSKSFNQIDRIRKDPQGLAADADKQDRLLQAINTWQTHVAGLFITPIPILKLLNWAGEPAVRKIHEAEREMKEITSEVIQDRRTQLRETGDAGDDLLGVLLLARDDGGNSLSDDELWEDVHDIIGAGHETTATTTACCLYNIAAIPGVQEKLQEEVDRVLGGRIPTMEDLQALQYTHQVVKETLRLYPPISFFPRRVEKDDILPSGHKIPGGDVVFMSAYAMGRNKDIWENPEDFDPDRFTPEKDAQIHRYAWVPFGAGARMCLGGSFAMMSVKQMIASLIQNFEFRAVKPNGPRLEFGYDITMFFPEGLVMDVIPRKR